MNSFNLLRTPRIFFGNGQMHTLGEVIKPLGNSALLVTGSCWLRQSGLLDDIVKQCEQQSIRVEHAAAQGEPTTDFVDAAAARCRDNGVSVVVAIGGGSALDAGKAIAAMARHNGLALSYLEGADALRPTGAKIPFIAIPTTAGTGSEATSNAVLSIPGQNGLKKSLRHPDFVPDAAIIDPQLMVRCPPHVTAACGMDAFTQLLESYVSVKASPITDQLALSGLQTVRDHLDAAIFHGENIEARTGMAFAALMSGITLANAGLGVVHGIAGVLGGLFSIPHGIVCARLLPPAVKITIHLLRRVSPEHPSLKRYAVAGRIVTGNMEAPTTEGCDGLLSFIEALLQRLPISSLRTFGVTTGDIDRIAASSGNRNNPIELSLDDIRRLLSEALDV